MVEALNSDRALGDTELLEAAHETGYADWYRHVSVARFRPELLDDPSAMAEGLRVRIDGLRALLASFEKTDYELDRPLVLDWHPVGARSDTGVSSHNYEVADGCHRLAILMTRTDRSELDTGDYRLRLRPLKRTLDNTRLLLDSGVVDMDTVLHEFAELHSDFSQAVSGSPGASPRAKRLARWTSATHLERTAR